MKPTAKLRFIEREIEVNGDHKPVRILQQWWAETKVYWGIITAISDTEGEWRDVPMESEHE